jgi:hypothetical protein
MYARMLKQNGAVVTLINLKEIKDTIKQNGRVIMANPDWFQSYDGMPEPMPKKPKPKPKRKKKTPSSRVSIHKGGVKPSGYTTSIGVGGMSFDHKMT